MASYTIERFHLRLLPGVAALRQLLFGRTLDTNMSYLEWMYRENPYIDEPLLFVALYEGVPVGMRGTLGTRWTCRRFSRNYTLPSFTDTGIHASHRDRGLYAELTNRAIDAYTAQGYSHVLNLAPTPENFVVSTLSTGGFKSIGEHGTLELRGSLPRVARLEEVAHSVTRRMPRTSLVLTAQERWARFRLRSLGASVSGIRGTDDVSVTVDVRVRPDAMAEFASRPSTDDRIRHVRDPQYIQWRYRNPMAHHTFVYAERDGSLVGYAVLQSATRISRVDIVDLDAVDEIARDALIDTIVAGRFGRLSIWSSMLSPSMISTLEAHGFRTPANRPRYADRILLRTLSNDVGDDRWSIEGVDLRRLENWDIRSGES